jgi:uncharacterized protein (UPF0335 family)
MNIKFKELQEENKEIKDEIKSILKEWNISEIDTKRIFNFIYKLIENGKKTASF